MQRPELLRRCFAFARRFGSSRTRIAAVAGSALVLVAFATALVTGIKLVHESRLKNLPASAHIPAPLEYESLRSIFSFFSWASKAGEQLPAYSSAHAGLLSNLSLRPKSMTVVPEAYPVLSDWEQQFAELARNFPQLVTRHEIGRSTARRHPLVAFRISDRPDQDEDEPAILFSALHHAREPAGVFICKAIMQELLLNYDRSARHRRLVDSLDIWLVPMVNPDGYQYIMENQRQFPWWRKNLRDNDNDGRFHPHVDGVDLNRNYDYNWQEGGEGETASWFYRGQTAFSENEIQALRDLESRCNFVIGVSFHSYGEAVLYPWGNFHRAPDQDLILEIARQYASQIGRLASKGGYSVLPLNGRVGQSSVWMYGNGGVIDFICETGEEYFPPLDDLLHLTNENVKGAMFLLERALHSGINGHVVDAETGAPLEAEIVIQGFERDYVKPRRSQPHNGRFDRLLLPGIYTVQVLKPGYQAAHFEKIEVGTAGLTPLEVALQREAAEEVMRNE